MSTSLAGSVFEYLGDDLTDEYAFQQLSNRGLKVLVREEPRETLADIRLTPPDELVCFLGKWISKMLTLTMTYMIFKSILLSKLI